MADIAEIGFRADTSDLVDAKAKLEAIAPAAGKAERASDKLNQSLSETGSAAQRAAAGGMQVKNMNIAVAGSAKAKRDAVAAAAAADTRAAGAAQAAAAATMAQGEAADVATSKLLRMRNAANQNVRQIQRMSGSFSGLAAQGQDIGVTAAMGMNPLIIGLQQGTQAASQFEMAMQGGASASSVLGAALRSLFSPTTIITIAIVTLVAAGLQMVDWANLAKTALNAFADVLVTIAPIAATVGVILGIAFAPSIAASIWAISTAIVTGLMAAITGIVATIGAVPILIGAAITSLFVFRDEITQALGVDIIGVVKSTINAIIGGFVGAYNAIIAVWSSLPAAFADLAVQAANALISGIESAVDYITKKVENFYNTIAGLSGGLVERVELGTIDLPEINNPNAGAAAGVLADATKAAQSAQGIDYVGEAYDFVGNMAERAADKVRDLASAIDLTDETKKKKGGKTDAEKFEDIVNGAERSIASLQAERDAIGLSEIATAKLKYETQLLNEAKQKNIDLSPAQRETLMGLAHDMASLEVETKRVREAFEFAKDVTKGFFNDFAQGIIEGEGFWESFGNAALNALDKIVDKLLDEVLNAIFEVNNAAGGSGGILGGLLGLIGLGGGGGGGSDPWAGMRLAKGAAFANDNIQRFAKGGDFTNSVVSRSTPFSFASGTAMGEMGEAGPEAIVPLKRMGNGDLGVAAAMPQAANTNQGPQVPGVLKIDITGTLGRKELEQAVEQGVEQGIRDFNDYALPARVNEIAGQPRVR